MKLIVAGSRTFDAYLFLEKSIFSFLSELKDKTSEIEIVSGEANGADKLGEEFAKRNQLKCTKFPADWDKYGKSAGYKRNVQMAEYADACIVFWDGISKGTQHMITIAKEHKLILKVIQF